MRHRKKSENLSRSRAQTKALIKSLVKALIINERIVTTTSRAKHLRTHADKLVTLGKKGTLFSRRMAYRLLGDHGLVKRLFDTIAPRFEKIAGGYTRVLKVKHRKGDGASLSILEFTKREEKAVEPKKQKEAKSSSKKKDEALPSAADQKKKGVASGVRKIFKKDRHS